MTLSTNRTEHLAVLQLIFLAVSVATFAVACGADGSAADSEGDDGNIHWQISGNELTLSKMGGQSSGDMDDYGPERPKWESGEGWDDVTTITVLDGVTSIGQFAFHEQASIASVTLPDSVKTIGNNAFQKCSALKSVDLGEGLTSMGFLVFDQCVSLTSIELPIGVTTVPMFIFNNCSSLSSVVIGEAVTLLEAGAFQYCTSLASIELPDMLNEIDMGVFVGCTSLTSIEIPDAVSYIGPSAFSDCSGLVSVILPDSLPSIGSVVFHKCTALKSVTIGKAVASIDNGQFQYCNAIDTVYYNSTELELDKDQAYWEAQNILFIHADSGSVTGAAFSGTLPSADAFVPPAGKGFDKYNTERGGTGQSYSPGDAYSLEGRQVLYAVWKDVPPLKITFNPNGGVGDAYTQEVTSGEPSALAENKFTRAGFTFTEWNTKANGTGTPYGDKQTVTIYEDLVLYAQWSSVPMSEVTAGASEHGTVKISGIFPNPITVCNGQKWTVTGSTLTIKEDERSRTFVLVASADDGYVFKNFIDGASQVLPDTGTITGNMIVRALFEAAPVPEYTVVFDANGHGTDPPAEKVKSGETVPEPEVPSAEGYTFGGWFKEPSCINKWDFAEDTVVQNTVLFAKWTKDPETEYTVTFDLNGHGSPIDPDRVKAGEKVHEPAAPSAAGYRFDGWYKDKECSEDKKWNFAEDTVTSDLTLFAKWVEQATVTYDANGHGKAPAADTVDKGSKISEPAAPSADGYRFDGWYKDKGCSEDEKWDFAEDTVTGDLTLFAKWTKVGSSSLPVIAAAVGIIALLVLVSAVAYRRP